jgi:hypothetical protein
MRQDLIVRRHSKKKASAKSGGWLAKEGPTTIKEAKVGVASRRKKEVFKHFDFINYCERYFIHPLFLPYYLTSIHKKEAFAKIIWTHIAKEKLFHAISISEDEHLLKGIFSQSTAPYI